MGEKRKASCVMNKLQHQEITKSSVVCAEWTEVLTVRFFANQPWLGRDLGRMRPGENQVRLHKWSYSSTGQN